MMNSPAQPTANHSQRFFELTKEGCQQLAALCDFCESEKSAIENHNVDDFKAVLLQKQSQLELISDNIKQRNELLTSLGFSADESGLNGFIESLPAPQAKVIRTSWEKLEQQLKQSIELNQRNELIVKRGQNNLSQLMTILQGHSPKTSLYDEKGGSGNYSAQNRLGKA